MAVSDELKKKFMYHKGDWRHRPEFSGTQDEKTQYLSGNTSGKVWHMFPDYIVYINGSDVSDFITSISINHNNLGQPSTCNINMINPELALNYTEQNVKGVFGADYRMPGKGGEGKLNTNKAFEIGEKIKKEQFTNKKTYQGGESADGLLFSKDPDGGSYNMWTLKPGDCCFNSNDPIRVFLKNPYIGTNYDSATGGDKPESQWIYGFTGFIDSVTDTEDAEMNGAISISCSDVRKLLKNARMATNNGVNIPLLNDDRIDLLQKDCQAPGSYTTKFANMTMTQIIISALNGTDWLINSGNGNLIKDPEIDPTLGLEANMEDPSNKIGGVGEWKTYISGVKKGDESGKLKEWQKHFDFRIPEGKSGDSGVETCHGVGQETRWGGARFPGNRHYDRLLILVPGTGFGKGMSVASEDPRNNISLYSEFVNRLDILNEYVQQMEMEHYTTPRGDMVFEVKLYAFDPPQFGERWGNASFLNDPNWGILQESDALTNISMTETDSDIQTFVRVTGRYRNMSAFADELAMQGMAPIAGGYGMGQPVEGSSTKFQKPTKFEKGQLRRFGLRYMQKALPHIYDHKILQIYAQALYAMLRANTVSGSVSMYPSFELGVNRPFLVGPRMRQFLVTNITHSISWMGDASTTATLTYPRSWNGKAFEEVEHPFLLGSQTQDPITVEQAKERQRKAKRRAKAEASQKKALALEDETLKGSDKNDIMNEIAQKNKNVDPEQAQRMNDQIGAVIDNHKANPPKSSKQAKEDYQKVLNGESAARLGDSGTTKNENSEKEIEQNVNPPSNEKSDPVLQSINDNTPPEQFEEDSTTTDEGILDQEEVTKDTKQEDLNGLAGGKTNFQKRNGQ